VSAAVSAASGACSCGSGLYGGWCLSSSGVGVAGFAAVFFAATVRVGAVPAAVNAACTRAGGCWAGCCVDGSGVSHRLSVAARSHCRRGSVSAGGCRLLSRCLRLVRACGGGQCRCSCSVAESGEVPQWAVTAVSGCSSYSCVFGVSPGYRGGGCM
jgi:hypothetical protein